MGFSTDAAMKALKDANGNIQVALDRLIVSPKSSGFPALNADQRQNQQNQQQQQYQQQNQVQQQVQQPQQQNAFSNRQQQPTSSISRFPEETHSNLMALGFTNTQENENALLITDGNVEKARSLLLEWRRNKSTGMVRKNTKSARGKDADLLNTGDADYGDFKGVENNTATMDGELADIFSNSTIGQSNAKDIQNGGIMALFNQQSNMQSSAFPNQNQMFPQPLQNQMNDALMQRNQNLFGQMNVAQNQQGINPFGAQTQNVSRQMDASPNPFVSQLLNQQLQQQNSHSTQPQAKNQNQHSQQQNMFGIQPNQQLNFSGSQQSGMNQTLQQQQIMFGTQLLSIGSQQSQPQSIIFAPQAHHQPNLFALQNNGAIKAEPLLDLFGSQQNALQGGSSFGILGPQQAAFNPAQILNANAQNQNAASGIRQNQFSQPQQNGFAQSNSQQNPFSQQLASNNFAANQNQFALQENAAQQNPFAYSQQSAQLQQPFQQPQSDFANPFQGKIQQPAYNLAPQPVD